MYVAATDQVANAMYYALQLHETNYFFRRHKSRSRATCMSDESHRAKGIAPQCNGASKEHFTKLSELRRSARINVCELVSFFWRCACTRFMSVRMSAASARNTGRSSWSSCSPRFCRVGSCFALTITSSIVQQSAKRELSLERGTVKYDLIEHRFIFLAELVNKLSQIY